jgi:hypothetical protein
VVADPPWPRHRSTRHGPVEPVAFDVVGLIGDERRQQIREVGSIHLSVGRHDDDEVHAKRDRVATTRRDGGADAEIDLVLDELDRTIALERGDARVIGAGIVDDDDAIHEARYPGERVRDQRLLLVGGHYGSNRSTGEHSQGVAIVSHPCGQGLA